MKLSASQHGVWLDPVAAYDSVATEYFRITERRRSYLEAIERFIIGEIPSGSRSMLDVGAGDGLRALRIAAAVGLRDVTLLEPSGAMRCNYPLEATIWPMRAEDLNRCKGSFDVIACLWNVLGHIAPAAARIEVLRQFARLLSPPGKIFIDLNHRYNARHYGALVTSLRFLRDRVSPAGANGDVQVCWDIAGRSIATTGHVFTHKEFLAMAGAAGLRVEKRFIIDYASGQLRPRSWEGNLLYVLRPS